MDRKWSLEVDAKTHLIEVDYGHNLTKTGELLVDGRQARTWINSQWKDIPPEIAFEVGGKTAFLRAKGLFNPRIDLFFEGKLIKQMR